MSDNSDEIFELSSSQLRKKSVKSRKRPKKKVSAHWDDDATYKLISFVETRHCLWNPKLKEYRNKNQRDAAWKEIYEIFDKKYSENELCAKWANLRIQCKSYAAKSKKTKSDLATGGYQIHWRFYKAMEFILSAEMEQFTQSESNLSFPEDPLSVETTQSTDVPSTSPLSPIVDFRPMKHKLELPTIDETKNCDFDSMNQTLKKKKDEENDEFKVFGDFIAAELRKIPNKVDANRIQRKMQRILLDYMDGLDGNNINENVITWLRNNTLFINTLMNVETKLNQK